MPVTGRLPGYFTHFSVYMIITITSLTSDNVNMHHASYAHGVCDKYVIVVMGTALPKPTVSDDESIISV